LDDRPVGVRNFTTCYLSRPITLAGDSWSIVKANEETADNQFRD
jgi:hypothetical protein